MKDLVDQEKQGVHLSDLKNMRRGEAGSKGRTVFLLQTFSRAGKIVCVNGHTNSKEGKSL